MRRITDHKIKYVMLAILLSPITSLCSTNTALAESDANAGTHDSVKPHKPVKAVKSHKKPGMVATGPVSKDGPIIAPPVAACGLQSARELNKRYNIHMWIIPVPNNGDSVFNDMGCWRSTLAKYGFGIFAFTTGQVATNTLNHYVPPSNQQRYAGQRTYSTMSTHAYLSYDLMQYGIPDGQIAIGGDYTRDTDIAVSPNAFTFNRIAYYQTAFNRALEFNAGLIETVNEFQGVQVGGNAFNPLGPGSALGVEAGAAHLPDLQPGAFLTYHMTPNLYDKAAIVRSTTATTPGGLGELLSDHYANPIGLNITQTPTIFGVKYPTSRALYIDEIGYRQSADANHLNTWIRATGFYNSTEYENLQYTTQRTTNWVGTIYADQQIWQSEPGQDATAYKGLYVGVNAGAGNPNANAVSQDYAARIYTFGLFGRPRDQISFLWEHQVVSPYQQAVYNGTKTCTSGTLCIHDAVNAYTLLYTANLMPGVYASFGGQYTDHPSIAWSPTASTYGSALSPVQPSYNIQHSMVFTAVLFLNF